MACDDAGNLAVAYDVGDGRRSYDAPAEAGTFLLGFLPLPRCAFGPSPATLQPPSTQGGTTNDLCRAPKVGNTTEPFISPTFWNIVAEAVFLEGLHICGTQCE
jgi:hypothetical protein